jgi:hypothetical protein
MNILLPLNSQSIASFVNSYRAQLIAVGACAVAGAALGLLQARSLPEKSSLIERWTLPSITRADVITISAEEIGARFWTEQARVQKAKATPEPVKEKVVPWSFVGTIDQGQTRVAVIVTETGKAIRLGVGQQLPDGAIIIQVVENGLTLDKAGTTKTMKLFMEVKSP